MEKCIDYSCNKKSTNSLNKTSEEQTRKKKFIPFQYYATTGEEDNEPSQCNSESTNSTWDQKMEEA